MKILSVSSKSQLFKLLLVKDISIIVTADICSKIDPTCYVNNIDVYSFKQKIKINVTNRLLLRIG